MFPVEICNLCKIKWVTSCRCVYELETLWSKQLQWSDLSYRHHGEPSYTGLNCLSWVPPFFWVNVTYAFVAGFKCSSVRNYRFLLRPNCCQEMEHNCPKGNEVKKLLRIKILGISKNCSIARNNTVFWTSR